MLKHNAPLTSPLADNKKNIARLNAKLLESVQSENTQKIEALLVKYGHVIPSYFKNVALRHAIKKEHTPIIILLLEHCKKKARGVALIIAAEKGKFAIVKMIVGKYKEDIHPEDIEFALSGAAQKGCTPIVSWLLLHFGKTELSNEAKCFSLINAVKENHIPIIKIFIQQHSDVIDNSVIKGSLLILAAERGYALSVIMLLHKFGHEISSQHKGESLVKSVERQHLSVVSILFQKCADQIEYPYKALAYKKALEGQNHDSHIEKKIAEKCLNMLLPQPLIHSYKNPIGKKRGFSDAMINTNDAFSSKRPRFQE